MKNNKEIVDGNKLIAVFHDYEYVLCNDLYNRKIGWWKRGKTPFKYAIGDWYLGKSDEDLKYNSDLNLLMKVLNKIEKECYNYIIVSDDHNYSCSLILDKYISIDSSSNESFIDAIWQTVVKFIKLKNEK